MLCHLKVVSKTPLELWNGPNPGLGHFGIWGCPVYVLRKKVGKLEQRTEVFLFVGYSKGTQGGLFYSPVDKKVFGSTNATFLDNDYIMNFKSHRKIVLDGKMINYCSILIDASR